MSPFPSHPLYTPGERWKYKAPPGQEDSRLVVLGAEKYAQVGWVIHISVEGLRIPAPKIPGGLVTSILHLPFLLACFERELIVEDKGRFAPVVFPNQGYETWKANQGGAWDLPVGKVVEMMAGFYSED